MSPRIVDVRLVVDRDDRVRLYVEGRLVLGGARSASEALHILADAIGDLRAEEQLATLARPEGTR